jgi:hypothetical protein
LLINHVMVLIEDKLVLKPLIVLICDKKKRKEKQFFMVFIYGYEVYQCLPHGRVSPQVICDK